MTNPYRRCTDSYCGPGINAGILNPGFAELGRGFVVKLYLINKLIRPGGHIIKRKHVLAGSDREALAQAADSADCPVCDVLKDGERVGSIL